MMKDFSRYSATYVTLPTVAPSTSLPSDTLPPRLLNEPIPTGPAKGKVSRLPEMLPGYYAVRGWDESGVPTDEKLQELGLSRL